MKLSIAASVLAGSALPACWSQSIEAASPSTTTSALASSLLNSIGITGPTMKGRKNKNQLRSNLRSRLGGPLLRNQQPQSTKPIISSVECDPHATKADTGVLCGGGNQSYCHESSQSLLGGFCAELVSSSTSMSLNQQRHLEDEVYGEYDYIPKWCKTDEYAIWNCNCDNMNFDTYAGNVSCAYEFCNEECTGDECSQDSFVVAVDGGATRKWTECYDYGTWEVCLDGEILYEDDGEVYNYDCTFQYKGAEYCCEFADVEDGECGFRLCDDGSPRPFENFEICELRDACPDLGVLTPAPTATPTVAPTAAPIEYGEFDYLPKWCKTEEYALWNCNCDNMNFDTYAGNVSCAYEFCNEECTGDECSQDSFVVAVDGGATRKWTECYDYGTWEVCLDGEILYEDDGEVYNYDCTFQYKGAEYCCEFADVEDGECGFRLCDDGSPRPFENFEICELRDACPDLQAGVPWNTESPTPGPTPAPTTLSPTKAPTTASPTKAPTKAPIFSFPAEGTLAEAVATSSPTDSPSVSPTKAPTDSPSTSPTKAPTAGPTPNPTKSPTISPTVAPTVSVKPTVSAEPTSEPTSAPTDTPTSGPTNEPTSEPTMSPTTAKPTRGPSSAPTSGPTPAPTTSAPTSTPTSAPTSGPTLVPTTGPTTPLVAGGGIEGFSSGAESSSVSDTDAFSPNSVSATDTKEIEDTFEPKSATAGASTSLSSIALGAAAIASLMVVWF